MSPERGRDPGETGVRELHELGREECLSLLASNRFGRLAVAGGHDVPIIRPVNYVFDESSQSVAFRTADGTKLHALVRATNAAFEIDGLDHATRTGWSVIIVGVTEQVTNPVETRHLDSLELDAWAPGEKHHWIRIRARTVSGRKILAEQASDPMS